MKTVKWVLLIGLLPCVLHAQNADRSTNWSVGVGFSAASFVSADEDIVPGQVDPGFGLIVSLNMHHGPFRARLSVNQEAYATDENLWTPTPNGPSGLDENLKLNNLKIGIGYMGQITDKLALGAYLDYGRIMASLEPYQSQASIIYFNNIRGQLSELSVNADYSLGGKWNLNLSIGYGVGNLEYRIDEVNLANESLVYLHSEGISRLGGELQLIFAF